MSGFARIEVVGNLGKDAELSYTQGSGAAKVTFSLPHTPRTQQGQAERTAWYRCTLVGKRAESLQQYLTKGQKVYVRGNFDAREWTGNDGSAKTSLDIFVSEIDLLGSKGENGGGQTFASGAPRQSAPAPRPAPKQSPSFFDDGDIPF